MPYHKLHLRRSFSSLPCGILKVTTCWPALSHGCVDVDALKTLVKVRVWGKVKDCRHYQADSESLTATTPRRRNVCWRKALLSIYYRLGKVG